MMNLKKTILLLTSLEMSCNIKGISRTGTLSHEQRLRNIYSDSRLYVKSIASDYRFSRHYLLSLSYFH